MKPFHYHEDPMYAAAAAILASQGVTEEAQHLEESYPGAPVLTKAQKLQNIKARRKEEMDAIAKIRKGHEGKHSAERSGNDMRRIDMHTQMLKKIDAREKQIMKMTEESELEEGVEDIASAVEELKKGDKTNFGVVTDIGSNSISFKAKDLPVTKIAFNQRKMGSKDFVLDKLVKLKEDVSVEEGIELEESIKTRIADLLLNLSGSDTSDMIKLAADTFKKNAIKLSHSVAADKKDEYKKAIEDMHAELLHSKTLTDFEKNGKKLAVQMKSFKEDVAAEEEDVSLEEGNGSYGMGTATITAPGNKLHGKQVSVFHKFDDGRLNVQYAKSDKKGDVLNLTLNKGQYKLD